MPATDLKPLGPRKPELKRFNLTLPASCAQRIADIKDLTEASSDSEVIRRAIQMYEKLVKGAIRVTSTAGGLDQAGSDDELPVANEVRRR